MSHRGSSESPKFPGITKPTHISHTLKHQSRKARNISKKSNGSGNSDFEETKEEHILKHDGSLKVLSTIEALPEVAKPNANSPQKMTSIERIAHRLEQETKNKPVMNIDKEYNDLKKILEDKHRLREEEIKNDGSKTKSVSRIENIEIAKPDLK